MTKTYIIIDSRGRATLHDERSIARETTTRLGSGDGFQVFEAKPLLVEIQLKEAGQATTVQGARAPKKPGRKPGRKKAGRRRAAKKAGTGTGKVGRPRVNVGTCTQADCKNPSKTRGLCSAHYQAHRRLVQTGKSGLITGGVVAKKRRGRPPGKKKKAGKRSVKKTTLKK